MSIETANFVVVRDGSPFKCKGSELFFTLDQRDTLLVSRNNVIHKVKLPFNLDTVASVENKSVNLDYEQYAFVRNRDNGQTLAETSPPFAPVQQELRVYAHLFDGNENTTFKSYTNNGIRHDLVVQFPEPIDIYESIRIKAGFHDHARTGEMLINGIVVRELTAWDGDPQVFSADFTGQVSEFSIRQKYGAVNGLSYTAVLNYIEIDGEKLKSVVPSSTELTLSSEADMSKYKVNMRIKKYQSSVTGVIGAVDEANKKITLTTPASFSANDLIIIDQVDGNPVEVPEILDTDLFAATDTDNVTYKVTGAQFKNLVDPPALAPWEDDNYGTLFHVRKENSDAWWDCFFVLADSKLIAIYEVDSNGLLVKELDRNNADEVTNFGYAFTPKNAGDYVITTQLTALSESTGLKDGQKIEFLSLTDTSQLTSAHGAFMNFGMSAPTGYSAASIKGLQYWDTSNTTKMSFMFYGTEACTIEGIENWDTSKVTTFARTFHKSGKKLGVQNINLAGWDTSKATTMAGMFYNSHVNPGQIGVWDVSSVVDSGGANASFEEFLFDHIDTTYQPDLTNWCVSNITSEPEDFSNNKSGWNTKPIWGTCPTG